MTGTVVWFNSAKGYGFLRSQDGVETFCHFSEIVADGYKELKKDQEVSYDVADGPKGKPQAVNVKVIS